MNNEAKLVATNVKNNPIISDEINRIAKPVPDVSGRFPDISVGDSIPYP